MNDTMFPEPRYIQTNGIRMAVHEKGRGLPVVFCHGFPELAYSWRHQLTALADAGFQAIAPDLRGYGLTDRPEAIEAYDIHHLCGDLAGLLDALGIEKAVFCGHDWGGIVTWMFPLLYPARVAGVIGVNTPFIPHYDVPPLQLIEKIFGEHHYIVRFQPPGAAEAILEKDIRRTFSFFMRKTRVPPEEFYSLPKDSPQRRFELLNLFQAFEGEADSIMPQQELEVFIRTFERTGFGGGINWYRNMDRNWETTAGLNYKIERPCLYVGAQNDYILRPSQMDGMEKYLPDLERHTIADCGHWTQQEKPAELNGIILAWLRKRFGPTAD